MFDPVSPRQSFPDLEEGILQYWQEQDMYRRSVEHREGREEFSFYDGPPFATGLPHYGHLLAGTIKDVIPRYRTMRGNKVVRRFGWDCHGLPVENLIEKEEGISGRQDIEAMGVGRFNDLCRMSVQRYVKEWRSTVERMGRWVDMDHDYRTMDAPYMESIWWVFQSLYNKDLIYEGHKPMHICPRCVTPLANFEVTQGYKDVTDISVTAKFKVMEPAKIDKVLEGKDVYFLAWTTTPWTLPGNLLLAIGESINYEVMHDVKTNEYYIISKEYAANLYAKIINTQDEHSDKESAGFSPALKKSFKGKKLVGLRYAPLFPYFVDQYKEHDAFKVVAAEFVETDEGTGIVHIAPGFGEDDFRIGKEYNIPVLQHVSMEGRFSTAVSHFSGIEVKPIEDATKTDKKIADYLQDHNLLFKKESYKHSYPHCWRCDSPLINYATSSWFVRVEQIKENMLNANAKTEWVPAHLRNGRFGNWLENARDWAISRNRYWGTPLPIWKLDEATSYPSTSSGLAEPQATIDEEPKGSKLEARSQFDVIGSRDELMQKNRVRFTKITAIRHAESVANVEHFFNSKEPGVPLTAKGLKQAEKAADFLQDAMVDIIYCSPMQRCLQTAQAIAKKTGAEIIIDKRLRETEMNEHEGTTYDPTNRGKLALKRKQKLQEESPESIFHQQGMEPWTDVEKRIKEFFDETLPKHRSEHVVVVTHGNPLTCVQHYFTHEDPIKINNRPLPSNAYPYTYYYDHKTGFQLDLHKEHVDGIVWPAAGENTAFVDATFIRHGMTDWNEQGKVQGGNIDEPLNDLGRTQIKELAERLRGQEFDAIICSDLRRAKESAEILSNDLDIPIVWETALLRERNTGDWSGKKEDDLTEALSVYGRYNGLALHPASPKEGESLNIFIERISALHEDIYKKYAGKKILIVCHSGVIKCFKMVAENLSHTEADSFTAKNGHAIPILVKPYFKRINEVLDCWFESGSMPYAEHHYPFEMEHHHRGRIADGAENQEDSGKAAVGASSSDAHLAHDKLLPPPNFPADFIAEGIDQTRGWFYTLTVLSSALFQEPAFLHCVVNGTVLAEDGRKMSKRLKNYPDPMEVATRHGADAMRFALMNSPAVRAEDLRFSEKTVEEAVRSVLLPLWNSYSFFITYANLAKFEASTVPVRSDNALDKWILAEVQDLTNRMTKQLDAYDLSASCNELFETIDALTNWYIRLSRRRFAGKSESERNIDDAVFDGDQHDALTTLHEVLLHLSQLLSPFCPFMTEAIYLNLTNEDNGSIHLTDWPASKKLSGEELALIAENRLLRHIVSLGLKVRFDAKVKVRTPLQSATVAFPSSLLTQDLSEEALALLRHELNVKDVIIAEDPSSLAESYVQVDARKVGPRLGKRVQEIIQAGKRGEFAEKEDGSIIIGDIILSADEAAIMYRSQDGANIAAERGVVVQLNTEITNDLRLEGEARDLIRGIQKLRKDLGYSLGERVTADIDVAAADILQVHKELIQSETSILFAPLKDAASHALLVGEDKRILLKMNPKS